MKDAAPAEPRGLVLASLDPAAARAQAAMARRVDPLALRAGGANLAARFEMTPPALGDHPWLKLDLGGSPAWVQVPWLQARRAAGNAVDLALPEDAALLVEAGLAQWLDEAEAATGLSMRFLSLEDAAPRDDVMIEGTLILQGRDVSQSVMHLRLAVRLPADAAAVLAGVIARRRGLRDVAPGLDLRLAWEREALVLDAARLRRLQPGDAIALSLRDRADRLVLEDQLSAPAEVIAPGRLRLGGAFLPPRDLSRHGDPAMSTGPLPEAAASDGHLDEIEIRLSFRAGETMMPLGTLRELAPGAIVEIGEDPDAVLDIVANGRRIGTGEMIEVAGRRAIRIRTLFANT